MSERRDSGSPVSGLATAATPLTGRADDYDALLDLIGDASFVLLGEATHGTQEFYRARAEISRRLIAEKGFGAVAVEGDWPPAYRVNRFVRGWGEDGDAEAALDGFGRFPLWMWRNTEMVEFIGWLRAYNRDLPPRRRAGFYGLDLYSLYDSVAEVIAYLERVDPAAAQRARRYYACLEHADGASAEQDYGYGVRLGMRPSCEDAVVAQLVELRRWAAEYTPRDGLEAEEARFAAEHNALVVANAEEYYRIMFAGRASGWNVRDRHMIETLHALHEHLSRHGSAARIVVWAHNSHVGDARATAMSACGEHNIGQLARQRYGNDTVLVGFTTYAGTVTAANDWDEPAQRKRVRPALAGSYERLFHEVPHERFFLPLRNAAATQALGTTQRLQRAIGVIYRPESELASHYFHCRLSRQFDAVFHFDHTRALEPLERTAEWERGEAPDTYPFGV